jgi:hypothetical protein
VNPIKKKAATGLHPSDGQTENQDKEPINMTITPARTDIRTRRRDANELSGSVRRNLRVAMHRQHIGPVAMARLTGLPLREVTSVYVGRQFNASAALCMQAVLGLGVSDVFATAKGN